jgi:sigma-E factor negative regulatory protein RseB
VKPRLALACSLLATLVGAVPAASLPAGPVIAANEMLAVELLERAREAAGTQPFEGMLAVEWRGRGQRHSEQVAVRNGGGVLRFGDGVVGAGARRMVQHGNDGWLTLWAHDVATLGPSPSTKYHLTVESGPDVAGRPTDLVGVRLTETNRLRERLYVDRHTGLLLRRELLDTHGEAYRSVAFTAIGELHQPPLTQITAVNAPRVTRSEVPSPARDLKAPYKLKSRIGTGYRLVGAYKANGVVQQYFSDGLHGLSVFEQRGHLRSAETDLAGERGAGREVEIAGRTMRAYSASVGEAVVWESDGVVYTALTDAPWSDLAAAVRDLPHADPPGRLRRVAQTVVSLFRWR